MARKVEEIESELMELGLDERAWLASKLIVSLDAPSEEENLALWVREAERRLQEMRCGSAVGIPGAEAVAKARAALS